MAMVSATEVSAAGASGMRAVSRPLPGVTVLQALPREDERGSFTRLFCQDELKGLGIARDVAQANLSRSSRRGTLRGLHYQIGPSAETKIVTCLAGAVHDVVLDLRPNSPAFGRSCAVELTAANRRLMMVPEGCAHGFMTLSDDALVLYFVSAAYDPVRERGVRWDDPAFAIPWPLRPSVVSARDRAHPDFDPTFHLAA